MADARVRGIFCIETVWSGGTDKTSTRPMLQWLHDAYGTPFLYRDAVAVNEFFLHLNVWKEKKCGRRGEAVQYPVLVLAFHGDSDGVWMTDQPEQVDTDDEDGSPFVELTRIANHLRGSCKNKVIHFASCSTIKVASSAVEDFLETTGASAVSGYEKEIDWTWSLAFDLLYLEAIQRASNEFLTPARMKEVSDYLTDERWLEDKTWGEPYPYNAVRKRLGFVMSERARPA